MPKDAKAILFIANTGILVPLIWISVLRIAVQYMFFKVLISPRIAAWVRPSLSCYFCWNSSTLPTGCVSPIFSGKMYVNWSDSQPSLPMICPIPVVERLGACPPLGYWDPFGHLEHLENRWMRVDGWYIRGDLELIQCFLFRPENCQDKRVSRWNSFIFQTVMLVYVVEFNCNFTLLDLWGETSNKNKNCSSTPQLGMSEIGRDPLFSPVSSLKNDHTFVFSVDWLVGWLVDPWIWRLILAICSPFLSPLPVGELYSML